MLSFQFSEDCAVFLTDEEQAFSCNSEVKLSHPTRKKTKSS